MPKRFDERLLDRLAKEEEIDVETRASRERPHRTTIWVLVVGKDAYIRSYRGKKGIWYRQLRASPDAAIYLGKTRIPIHAIYVRSPRIIKQVSAEYLRKYHGSQPARAMVKPFTLATTLRIVPR